MRKDRAVGSRPRSRSAEVRELARNPGEPAVERLMQIARGNDQAAVAACEVIPEWGHGPVEQPFVVA